MSDTPETIGAILAEMREAARSDEHADGPLIEDYADRIEAAAKRLSDAKYCEGLDNCEVTIKAEQDKSAAGNVAALREALNQLRDWALLDINENAIRSDEPNYKKLVDGIVDITSAALAAPARNADRPECKTLPDAIRFGHFECGHREWWVATMTSANWHDFADWLFAPAEGGKE